jgi:hypothetical protein
MKPWATLLLTFAAFAVGHAQTKTPLPSSQLHGTARYARPLGLFNRTSATSFSATVQTATTAASLPLWTSHFTYGGKTYPYTMVGRAPSTAATTSIGAVIIPINFVFTEWRTPAGHFITLNGSSSIVGKVQRSPLFVAAGFPDGTAQFGDAVQRANFWNASSPLWHTRLYSASVQPAMTITVPNGMAQLFQMPNGTLAAAVDANFLDGAFNAQLAQRTLQPNQLAILLARNILIYSGDLSNCCILGFHTAFANLAQKQTLIYATWLDSSIGVTVFSDSSLADITPLAHETVEWMMDPMLSNIVPSWRSPGSPAGTNCSNILEAGDPIEVLQSVGYPLTVNGMKYHPQNEALISWFEDQKTSSAFSHAYSFPNMSLLSTHSAPCN